MPRQLDRLLICACVLLGFKSWSPFACPELRDIGSSRFPLRACLVEIPNRKPLPFLFLSDLGGHGFALGLSLGFKHRVCRLPKNVVGLSAELVQHLNSHIRPLPPQALGEEPIYELKSVLSFIPVI